MTAMTRMERFRAAVAGGEVDRPPTTVWLHFATDHLLGEETAARHLQFLRAYGWDIAKVMNDYRYPLPEGLEVLESAADMRRFEPIPVSHPTFAEQLKCLKTIRAELGAEWPIVDTVFDPLQQVLRKVGFSQAAFVFAYSEAARHMLEAVTESLVGYCAALKEAGVDGVLYSINGAICPPHPRGVDDATFRAFQRPHDLRVLEAMAGLVRICHVHGTHLDFDRVLDYPCEVFSWSDRLEAVPSLAELRARTDRCLMGGINEETIIERTLPELRAEIADAVAQVGSRGLILTPGCTVRSQCPQHILRCVADSVRALAAA